ncbi:PrsW family intramembrane metalloprotease [Lysinimonas soli]|uniref:PrsW family intramembrane metalloprotease n=1 Tax=Lysinimonas soli TaxID=1074233 RepID=A0ABW0NMQ0_9MICO
MTAPDPADLPADSTPATLAPEAPAEVQASTRHPAHPALGRPAPHRSGLLAAGIVGYLIVGAAVLLVVVYFLSFLGPGLTVVGAVLALVPLAIVLLGIRWIDRWEPEPFGILLFAFLWGAGVSIVLALTVDVGVQLALSARGGPTDTSQLLQSVVQAPIVEESAKGLGVLLIFLVARRYFDGPVDGVVYAATVAAGFAFSENIQYFGEQISSEGGFDGSVAQIFFIRGLLSPFAHVMFTAMTGLFIGMAARRGGRLAGVGLFFVGLVPAILLHAFWNGSLAFVSDFLGYYLLVQMPLFAIGLVAVVLLRRREVRLTQLRLGEYAAAGWFNAGELQSLATPVGRRRSMSWAKSNGVGRLMRSYIRDATRLAFTRNRIVTQRDHVAAQAEEAALLARVSAERGALAAAVSRVPAG